MLRRILPLTAAYLAVVAATHYIYFADTTAYVQNILAFERNPVIGRKDFWDFGHLLWRPFGWLLFRTFSGLFSYTKSGESNLTIAALLIIVSIVSGLVTLLLFRSLATRFVSAAWVADFIAIAFLCFYAFLNYVQTGTPYIVGLMWLTISLWFILGANESNVKGRRSAVCSGIAAALAVLFWFPYFIAIPGVLAVPFLWRPPYGAAGHVRSRAGLTAVALASAGLLVCAAYIIPLIQLHIHSVAELNQWVFASSHGWAQNKRLLRMASGLPRSFIWTGDQGMMLKRYLLHDPYAPVTLAQIILGQFWRILIFYIFLGCLLWVLWRSKDGRRVLYILAAAGVPMLLFAVLVFESGSIERYLPVYPFLCLAVAFCVSRFRQQRVAVACVVAFLCITILADIGALWRSSVLALHRPTADRARSLQNRVGPQGLVALLSLWDDLFLLTVSFPFEPVVRRTALPVYDVVAPGTERTLAWRREFAWRALQALEHGQNVWVSKRLLADRPAPEWGWTDSDDPNISWKDLRPFFSRLTYSVDLDGADGFLQVTDSPQNKAFLSEVVAGRQSAGTSNHNVLVDRTNAWSIMEAWPLTGHRISGFVTG